MDLDLESTDQDDLEQTLSQKVEKELVEEVSVKVEYEVMELCYDSHGKLRNQDGQQNGRGALTECRDLLMDYERVALESD